MSRSQNNKSSVWLSSSAIEVECPDVVVASIIKFSCIPIYDTGNALARVLRSSQAAP